MNASKDVGRFKILGALRYAYIKPYKEAVVNTAIRAFVAMALLVNLMLRIVVILPHD